ncbi:SUN domain-containing protein 3-like [Coccinella septempunctata]|uniref:SUN domain-containing protein 3-like n=1 Tax=Coccinella septempunctata TaxID=41139 RepID=UPI001D05F37B|nr:SUN domain-containing protein 3-like [Coccinella septempunctata]
MNEDAKSTKEPTELIPVDEKLCEKLEKQTYITNTYQLINHFFKCVLVAIVVFILLEKISRKYKVLHVANNYEEDSTEVDIESHMKQKDNLTFFCDQKVDLENDSIEALTLLREDVLNLKQLVLRLGEQLRERRRFECLTKKELSRIEERVRKVLAESDMVDVKIKNALHTYEADKVALFDYAAGYAGGAVVSLLDTVPAPTKKISQLLGFFRLAKDSTPDQIINPSCLPGECFTFLGDKAKIVIKLGKPIIIGSISMEHSFLVEDISSAPKEFQVFSLQDQKETAKELLGKFTYEVKNRQNLQTYEIPNRGAKKTEYVMLEILNNHGNNETTSIYRFRVHSR